MELDRRRSQKFKKSYFTKEQVPQYSVALLETIEARNNRLHNTLENYGYAVVTRLPVQADLVALLANIEVDIVIINVYTLEPDVILGMKALHKVNPHPVIIVSQQDAHEIITLAVKSGVSAYVVDDIEPQRLPSVITVAKARFDEFQLLRQELMVTKDKLANRKLLERAKGLLMKHRNISEDAAFASLRKMAMDKGQTIPVVAQNIIDVLTMINEDINV